MDLFSKEVKILNRVIYKSKNAHRNTLYYKKLVHVKRICARMENSIKEKKNTVSQLQLQPHIPVLKKACTSAYVAASSNIPLGHHIALSVLCMSLCASIFYLSSSISAPCSDKTQEISVRIEESEIESEDTDEISDIFNL